MKKIDKKEKAIVIIGSGAGGDDMVAELNTNSSLFEHEKINIKIIGSIFFILCVY